MKYRGGWATFLFPGWVNFVPAVAFHFCLNLPEKFSQPAALWSLGGEEGSSLFIRRVGIPITCRTIRTMWALTLTERNVYDWKGINSLPFVHIWGGRGRRCPYTDVLGVGAPQLTCLATADVASEKRSNPQTDV